MPIMQNMDPTEERMPDVFAVDGKTGVDDETGFEPDASESDLDLSDGEVLAYLGDAKRSARNYQQISTMAQWEYGESAYRSDHTQGSKYRKDQYKNRAKYFKPKTRNAVRKALTATRAALASSNIISCEASDDGNEVQRANSALLQELINIRLNNKTRRSGVRWFQTAIGARRDCQVLGVCCSKQDWKYRVRTRMETQIIAEPVIGEDGMPVVDFVTGEPVVEEREVEQEIRDVLIDRPEIKLIPVEYVLLVPTTDWIDPAQDSPVMIVQHPMHVDSVRSMMEDDEKSVVQWRDVSDDELMACKFTDLDLNAVKVAREGADGAQQNKQGSGRTARSGMALDIIDVWECFFHYDGEDYHCWTLRDQVLLSDPVPVMESYPAHRGSRPYVIGTDQIEPHVLYPDSHVYTWKQQQDEINDFTNLRMDATRHAIYPTAKVVAGRNIDYRSVQRRDSQGVVLVRDQNDISWDRPPGPSAQAYQEANLLSNDFDESAGNFSQNSVQSNRSLNETVGGMQIIAAAAGATSEFDLATFIETWVEPVMSQLVSLEQYYEDDATLLAVAGGRAKLFQRYGISEITDELLESQVTVSVNVGVGSADPMMKLMRLKTVMELFMPYYMMAREEGGAKLNIEEIAAEIFGNGGFKNGADRFVEFIEQEGPKMVPADKMQELMQAMKAMKGEMDRLKSGDETKLRIESARLADKDKDRQFRLMMERMKQGSNLRSDEMDISADMTEQRRDQEHDIRMLMLERGAATPVVPVVPRAYPQPF